jgi:hypothetical protein
VNTNVVPISFLMINRGRVIAENVCASFELLLLFKKKKSIVLYKAQCDFSVSLALR